LRRVALLRNRSSEGIGVADVSFKAEGGVRVGPWCLGSFPISLPKDGGEKMIASPSKAVQDSNLKSPRQC